MASEPAERAHQDPGLQPERTVMSWGRTTLSLCVAGAIFLRWTPHYGVGALLMVLVAVGLAGGIYLSQRRRYAVRAMGLAAERIHADVAAVFWMSASVLVIGTLGLVVVLSV